MNLLDDCPVCLYEEKTITARDFTFVGLIPPPASGDNLGVCVGCRKCRRSYCKTQSYYHPLLPPDLKLRDEHVGEEGCGLWLRFGQSDRKGPVQIEYESCSLPEDTCKKPVSMKLALNYLRQDRVGHPTPKVCKTHADDFARLTAAVEARVRGNDKEQKSRGAEKNSHGGARNVKWTPEQEEEFLARYEEVLPKIRRRDQSIPQEVIAELLLPGNSPSDVARDFVAQQMGVESNDYLRTLITRARKRRKQNALHSSSILNVA